MKNNGFTLVELMAVLILLAIVGSIGIIKVSETLSNARKNVCDNNVNSIINSSKEWAGEHMMFLPTKDKSEEDSEIEYGNLLSLQSENEYSTLIINVGMLLNDGYLSKKLFDEMNSNQEIISEDTKIKIILINNNYEYIIGDGDICEGVE